MDSKLFDTAFWYERIKLQNDFEAALNEIDAYYDEANRKVRADKCLSAEEKKQQIWENNEQRNYEKICAIDNFELSQESLRMSFMVMAKEIQRTHPTSEGFLWNAPQYKDMNAWHR
ncbi:MAG: hypothetical protein IJL45_00165 [Prevotella sp.]|nr:hypothetical protein [Prevotella sp.]